MCSVESLCIELKTFITTCIFNLVYGRNSLFVNLQLFLDYRDDITMLNAVSAAMPDFLSLKL